MLLEVRIMVTLGEVGARGSDDKENLWGFLTGVDISELFLLMTFQV